MVLFVLFRATASQAWRVQIAAAILFAHWKSGMQRPAAPANDDQSRATSSGWDTVGEYIVIEDSDEEHSEYEKPHWN